MSKGKGYKAKATPQTTTTVQPTMNAPKLSTPETAMSDIGEHYFHTAAEKAPAGQYENTLLVIGDHAYGKGYKEAAETMEAGRDILPSLPKRPVKADVQTKPTTTAKVTGSVFDIILGDTCVAEIEVKGSSDVKAETTDTKPNEEEIILFETLEAIYLKEIDLFVKVKAKLKEGKCYCIRVVWAQCSSQLKSVLMNRKGFTAMKMSGDLVGALEHVRTACYDFDISGNQFNIYWHALNRLVSTRQRRDEDGHSLRERLLKSMKRFEQVGGNMSGMITMDKEDETMSDECHSKILVQRLAAMMMLQQSDNVRYGTVKKDFCNVPYHVERCSHPIGQSKDRREERHITCEYGNSAT